MRAITNTTISYGLQNIPVGIYTLSRDSGLGTSWSCPDCEGDIGNKNYCKSCSKEFTAQKEMNKAYKLSKDSKIIIDKERLKAIYEKENTINVLSKMPRSAIDYSLINGSYFLLPNKLTKVWTMLQKGLTKSKNVILCTFSIKGRTKLGIITSKNDVIVLLTLAYSEQLVKLEEKYGVELTKQELDFGTSFIEQLPDGNFEDIKDTFKERFEKILQSEDPIEIVKPEEKAEDDISFFTQKVEVKAK